MRVGGGGVEMESKQSAEGLCGCRRCIEDRGDTINGLPRLAGEMVVCKTCGSKRCPHAADHRHSCTDSNDPGQLGSAYGRPLCAGCERPGGCTAKQMCARSESIEASVESSGQIPNHNACAADYYRAGVERRAPKWVPARVKLASVVRGDFPVGHTSVAEAGEHDCDCNKWGAVSVKAGNGKMLGLRPAEFDVVAWKANDKA